MDTIKISEWFDGYCLTHNGVDYKYQGKSESVIKMIADKVHILLNKDLEQLKKSLLKQHNLS